MPCSAGRDFYQGNSAGNQCGVWKEKNFTKWTLPLGCHCCYCIFPYVPQGNVIFALPFVPGHQPLRATDIGGLIFVMTGLVVYRFGPALNSFFGRIESSGDRVAKVAASIRGRASGSSYAVGDHREPLLNLAEEGEEYEVRGLHEGRRMGVRGGGQGQRKKDTKPSRPVNNEWEM